MSTPYLSIDLQKIEHNARTITSLCGAHGVRVSGVTKCTCGNPEVAKAMLRGGVVDIADSRLENINRMRNAGLQVPFTLLRLPPLSGVDEVIAAAHISLNSELRVLESLSLAALRRGRVHEVILMVDMGDLREGMWPDELNGTVRKVLEWPGIRIRGLGTNLTCFAGVLPVRENMEQLVRLVEEVERTFGIALDVVSGINSSGLELLASGSMPARVNHARIGEAILLGLETAHRKPWPDTYQDAFLLHGEVLELRKKPTRPLGARSQDAFGALPDFDDRGHIPRALVNLGRQDVSVEGIAPLDPGIRILGASSGYLVLDVAAAQGRPRVGDTVSFAVNYSALLAAMTSEYVKKEHREKHSGRRDTPA